MSDLAKTTRVAPLPGTARLGVASGLFTVFSISAAIATYGLGRRFLIPPTSIATVPHKILFGFLGALSMMVGCARTSRLLDRRRKEGIATAVIFLTAPLWGYLTGAPPTPDVICVSVGGIAVLASVWRHLDR